MKPTAILAAITIVACVGFEQSCLQNAIASNKQSSASSLKKQAPRKTASKNPAAKNSNNPVTGTYSSGNDALGSELKAKEIAGGKLKFSLYSFWRCPDGTACNGIAEGTIKFQNRKGFFHQSDPEYTLHFDFSKGGCTVDCDKPSNFGGFNVDPTGDYKKVSSKVVFD